MYRSVKLYPEIENVCNQLTEGAMKRYTEMTAFEHSFLCGLLREKKPRKVLEIGVAAGGTTAVVLSCLKEMNISANVHSVDVSEEWYRGGKRTTGFGACDNMNKIIGKCQHKFWLGKSIPWVIEDIGGDIDFLILDTTNALPEETLDFLVCLPFLQDGCVVVLHDVIENLLRYNEREIATKLLFDSITAEKYYMEDTCRTSMGGLSNIGAFVINDETRQNIRDVISALSFSWSYILQQNEERQYLKIIKQYYDNDKFEWMKRLLEIQKKIDVNVKVANHYKQNVEKLKLAWKNAENVYLYGAGYWSGIYREFARLNDLPTKGCVISNEQGKPESTDLPVYKLKELKELPEQVTFVIACEWRNFPAIKKAMDEYGFWKVI